MANSVAEEMEKVLEAPSLYPKEKRKPRQLRERELSDWLEKYGEVNRLYNFYGLDLEGSSDCNAFLDRRLFREQRFKANSYYIPSGSSFSYDFTSVMRDKSLFEAFCAWCLNKGEYVRSYGVVDTCGIRLWDYESYDKFALEHQGETLVFKTTFGCSGLGILPATISDGGLELRGKVQNVDSFLKSLDASASKVWLVQPRIRQHSDMSRFNQSSVNTLRMLTFNTGQRTVLLDSATLRFGRKGSFVDNADHGGLCVNVSKDGVVKGPLLNYASLVADDSPFDGAKIPFFKDAKRLILKLHSYLPQLFSVGWDVAITPDGPMVVEGNDGWDPYLLQAPRRMGLREMWDVLLNERIAYFRSIDRR